MSLGYYKRLVRINLEKAVGKEKTSYINLMMKEYDSEFPKFLEQNWSPEVTATAILMGY